MNLLIATTPYKNHTKAIYNRESDLASKSVLYQKEVLQYNLASSFEFWSNEFENLGLNANIVFPRIPQFQEQWVNENKISNINFNEEEVLLHQIKEYKTEILFIFDFTFITKAFLHRVREISKNIIIATWYGAPISNQKDLSLCDYVLTNSKNLCYELKNNGIKVNFIPHAFEPSIYKLREFKFLQKSIDFSFIGSINDEANTHLDRSRTIEHLSRETGIQVWSDLDKTSFLNSLRLQVLATRFDFTNYISDHSMLKKFAKIYPIKRWSELKVRPNLNFKNFKSIYKKLHQPVYGQDMLRILGESELTFNGHSLHTGIDSVNMRLFEASGMGTCQLVDDRPILYDFFEPDHEILTFKTVSEAISKSKELLNDDRLRNQIAENSKKKTLSSHTTKHQVIQVLDFLNLR